VQLDGKQLDRVTPLVAFPTQAGQHKLVVTNAAGAEWSESFTADIDGKPSFTATFPPPPKKGAAGATPTRTAAVTERATERTPDRATERVTERAPDRATERGGDRPVKRGGAVTRNGKEPEIELPAPAKEPEPPPPPKPDAGVPVVAQEPPRNTAVAPAAPKAPPFVAVNTVTKLSGDIPQIKANVTEPFTDVTAKVCIRTDGHVSSVKMLRALPEIIDEVQRGLMGWRYRPYMNSAGQAS